MTRFHDINFFVKLGLAFALMVVAWAVPGWWWGVPIAALTVLFLAAAGVPGLSAYLKGASLLVLLVMASSVSYTHLTLPTSDLV